MGGPSGVCGQTPEPHPGLRVRNTLHYTRYILLQTRRDGLCGNTSGRFMSTAPRVPALSHFRKVWSELTAGWAVGSGPGVTATCLPHAAAQTGLLCESCRQVPGGYSESSAPWDIGVGTFPS